LAAKARQAPHVLGEPVAIMEAVFAELAMLGMIADGAASAWSRRQFEGDNSTERSRKHREAKRNAAATGGGVAEPLRNGDETLQQRCATPPYTDTDTDTEDCVGLRAPARETPDATADLRQSIVSAFSEVRSPTIPDTSRAGVWLAKGYQPAICLATIREGLARKPGIRSLAYFDQAIADAHAPASARAPPGGRPPNRPLTMIDGLIAHDARQAARTDR
jgi:hypothetical protein